MATKTIKAWINGAIQYIEVEDIVSPEQPISVEKRVDTLEDKHEVVFTDGNLLVGNGTNELEEMTPDEVLSHINGANVMTMTTEEFEALSDDEVNANTLYMMTDSDDRPDWNQTDETAVDYIKNKPDISAIQILSVSSEDNGKFLRVVDGAPTWTTIDNAEGVTF